MSHNPKIKDLVELAGVLLGLKSLGKKIVHCHGVFDLVHPGHVRHFHAAKSLGDVLIVTVTPDNYVNKGPGRPVFNQELRVESITALECVDYAAINSWPNAVDTIKLLQPDIYVKGREFIDDSKDETLDVCLERAAIESIGGKIHFTDEITFSSSSLLNEYFGIYPEPVRNFLAAVRKRYSAQEIIERLKSLKKVKALLVGETILDEYHFMNVIGKPPKGTHIAAKFIDAETHAGGILACANHLANFCGSVDLVTAIGRDSKADFVSSRLKPNVNLNIFYHPEAPTIIKRRFVDSAFYDKLFEVYVIDDRPSPDLEKQIFSHLLKVLSGSNHYDLILILDYGHGLLTPRLIELICSQNQFLAVNAQTNTANLGFNPITKYRRADYFCLDEPELRLAFQDKDSDIGQLVNRLAQKVSLSGAITVTKGSSGSVTYDVRNHSFFEAPVLSQNIVDTTGAGDAFLAITAPCVAERFPMDLIPFIGNAVGALAVGYLGNRSSVEADALYRFLSALLK